MPILGVDARSLYPLTYMSQRYSVITNDLIRSALQVKVQELEAEKSRLDEHVQLQLAKFGECREHFAQLFQVQGYLVCAHVQCYCRPQLGMHIEVE